MFVVVGILSSCVTILNLPFHAVKQRGRGRETRDVFSRIAHAILEKVSWDGSSREEEGSWGTVPAF